MPWVDYEIKYVSNSEKKSEKKCNLFNKTVPYVSYVLAYLWFSYALQIAYFKFASTKKNRHIFWLTKMRDNNFVHVSFIVTLWLTKWICLIEHFFPIFLFSFFFCWRKTITTTLCLMPYTPKMFEFPSKTHLPASGWESTLLFSYSLASYVEADRVRIVQCI